MIVSIPKPGETDLTDQNELLDSLRRPRLLVRAARAGLPDYNRDRDLPRLMRTEGTPRPMIAVERLMDEETRLEETRQAGTGCYSPARHVDVLIALMGEARLLPRRPPAM